MRRVLIIGSPGSGKSTLAGYLARRTGLPLHHLDQMHWLPGWTEREAAESRALLADVLGHESWIIDGNYGSSMPLRLARADTVIWLDYPTWLCLARVVRRWWRHRGRTRPDMTEGCPERLDPEFLLYVVRFRGAWGARNSAALEGFGGKILRFTAPRRTARWLAAVPMSPQPR